MTLRTSTLARSSEKLSNSPVLGRRTVSFTLLPAGPRMRVIAPARSAPTSESSIFTMRSPESMPASSAGEPSMGRRIFTAESSATTSMPTPG